MILNWHKFQSIIIDKKKWNHANKIIKIDEKQIEVSSTVKRLAVQTDNKLSFNLYITKRCRAAANQSNVLVRLKKFSLF